MFADLHDTAGRMQDKGCINVRIKLIWKLFNPDSDRMHIDLSLLQDTLTWENSRHYLYWRFRRLLLEERVTKAISTANPMLTIGQMKSMISRWFLETQGAVNVSVGFCWTSWSLIICLFPCCSPCRHICGKTTKLLLNGLRKNLDLNALNSRGT